jgi:phage shock protein A
MSLAQTLAAYREELALQSAAVEQLKGTLRVLHTQHHQALVARTRISAGRTLAETGRYLDDLLRLLEALAEESAPAEPPSPADPA